MNIFQEFVPIVHLVKALFGRDMNCSTFKISLGLCSKKFIEQSLRIKKKKNLLIKDYIVIEVNGCKFGKITRIYLRI